MVNYYKQFSKFIEQEQIQKKTRLVDFKQKMMLFFGFGGRNNTIEKWINNFETVGYIKTLWENNIWYVILRDNKN